jgi:hypothetical protein
MSLRRLFWILPALLLISMAAQAGSVTAKVYFNGQYAFANNGYGIPPYGGTLNGQSVSFYCVDFTHDIYANTSWYATVTKLNSPVADFADTRIDNKTKYLEMAWLITQMGKASSEVSKAQFQWAVWSFSGGPDNSNAESLLISDAVNAVDHGYKGNGWELLTPNGSYGQEFLVDNVTPTPEPSGLILFGSAMLGMFILRKRIFAAQ